jgi:hypothetical protein
MPNSGVIFQIFNIKHLVNFSPNIHREKFFWGLIYLHLRKDISSNFLISFLVGIMTILFFWKKFVCPQYYSISYFKIPIEMQKNKTTPPPPPPPKNTHTLLPESPKPNTKTKKKKLKWWWPDLQDQKEDVLTTTQTNNTPKFFKNQGTRVKVPWWCMITQNKEGPRTRW